MSPEDAARIQTIAAAVQAFAAVVVLWLTRQLIQATRAYVETTRDQLAELRATRLTGEAQLAELRQARDDAKRAHIQYEYIGSTTGGGRYDLKFEIANLGNGSALDLKFERDNQSAFVAGSQTQTVEGHQRATVELAARIAENVQPKTRFELGYHDIDGERWIAWVDADLSQPTASERILSQGTEKVS